MSSFVNFNCDASPRGCPDTPQQVWNYQRGFYLDGSDILDQNKQKTTFMYYGEPETVTGWLDSGTDDERFFFTTGPFQLPPWEDMNENYIPDFKEPGVQEIVVVFLMARGENNLNSVTELKKNEFAF